MSTFGEDLVQAIGEALAHAKGESPAIVHAPVDPREIRMRAKLAEDKATQNPPIVDARHPLALGNEAFKSGHLLVHQPVQVAH